MYEDDFNYPIRVDSSCLSIWQYHHFLLIMSDQINQA